MILSKLINDRTEAMKNKDASRLSVLRMLINTIQAAEKDKHPEPLTEGDEIAALQKYAKKLNETIALLSPRTDEASKFLVDDTLTELNVVLAYLPKQLSADEVAAIVDRIISETLFPSFKTVMPVIMKELKGKTNGAFVKRLVKEKLEPSLQ